MPEGKSPNILVIMADQWSASMLTCAGSDIVHTPHLDRLAQGGVRFEQAYSTAPLCGPFRAGLITGRYPHEIGAMVNGTRLEDDLFQSSMGNLLQQAGYDTAYAGKWHVPEGSIQRDADRFGFEALCGMDDTKIVPACNEFLGRQRDQPFLLFASFDNPHNICEHARDQLLPWGEVDVGDPAAYPNLPTNFAAPPYEAGAIDLYRRSMPPAQFGFDANRWRYYRHVYARLIERVDQQIGDILDALDRSGQADDTLVLFFSDHGDHAGAHGLNQKSTSYEESVRVPLIVRAPQAWGGPRGTTRSALVDAGLDILPTLLHAADSHANLASELLRGRSLHEALANPDPPAGWRDHLVAECQIDRSDIQWRMVRSTRHKYTLFDRGPHREMLFDLHNDPCELVNLAVERRHAGLLQTHREKLNAWCKTTADTFASHHALPPSPRIPGVP